jgi:quercetin dioxygenase-like cupin family protein
MTRRKTVKQLYAAVLVTMFVCAGCGSTPPKQSKKLGSLLTGAPYRDGGMGKKKLVDDKHLLMMQAALKPGQAVPQHNANSNVQIVVLDGEVVINLSGKDIVARQGDLVPVAFKTPMNIKNKSRSNATFLIIKTPNPSQMGKAGRDIEK